MNRSGARAAFGMYPFMSVRAAWDEIWTAVAVRCDWADATLEHTSDVHVTWADPTVDIHHVCGWPYAAWYDDAMLLVGAFDVELPGEVDVGTGRYRSVLVSRHDRTLGELVDQRAHAVVNSVDSLSGCLSLLAAASTGAAKWPGRFTETGSHLASLCELAAGRADVACIDSWTLALIRVERPDLVEGVHRVGYGPIIPTPAVTVRSHCGPNAAAELGVAFREALADSATASARRALHIRGFAVHEAPIYRDTLRLG